MVIKWKNIINHKAEIIRDIGIVVLIVCIIGTILHIESWRLDTKGYVEAVKGTEYTNTTEYKNFIYDAFNIMENAYTEKLLQKVSGYDSEDVDDYYDITDYYEYSDYEDENDDKVVLWSKKVKYSYKVYGIERERDIVVNFIEDGYKRYYTDTVMSRELAMSKLDYMYIVESPYRSGCFTNCGRKKFNSSDKGILIEYQNKQFYVTNTSDFEMFELDKNLIEDTDEDKECVLQIENDELQKVSGEWNKLSLALRIFLTGILLSAVFIIRSVIYMKKHAQKPMSIRAYISKMLEFCVFTGRTIRKYIVGFLTGEVWYKKGFVKAELIRTFIAVGVLFLCALYEIYSYNISQSGWNDINEIYIVFNVIIISITSLVILGYIVGTFIITKRYKKLQGCMEKISKGDFKNIIQNKDMSPFEKDYETISGIGVSFEESLNTRIKSERTKIELVTNVSHDLKTPLTSIISYIDLLKRMDNLPDESMEYIGILEQKSDRLKAIVSDVFELAKTTSGEIKLDIQKININKLITQTLAILEDKIRDSEMAIKTGFPQDEIYIYADGEKLYRVLQNLVDNALKYSLKGTRIYIEEKVIDKTVFVTVKNTANYEMDFQGEDVTERFFCGDKSRNTEGHGLGLSIAQGFVVVCGGKFDVVIDGDQFKVTITFPVSEEITAENE